MEIVSMFERNLYMCKQNWTRRRAINSYFAEQYIWTVYMLWREMEMWVWH